MFGGDYLWLLELLLTANSPPPVCLIETFYFLSLSSSFFQFMPVFHFFISPCVFQSVPGDTVCALCVCSLCFLVLSLSIFWGVCPSLNLSVAFVFWTSSSTIKKCLLFSLVCLCILFQGPVKHTYLNPSHNFSQHNRVAM